MTSSSAGDPRVLGSLRSVDGKGVVRIEDRFGAPIDDVWTALTDPLHLARWLGRVEGDLRVGGEFRARFYASEWEGTGRVEVCERPHRLLVLTKDADHPEEAPIEITLRAEHDQTVVVWEQRGLPLDLIAGYGAGIQIHVEDLRDNVGGSERRDARGRFEALFAAYQRVPVGDG